MKKRAIDKFAFFCALFSTIVFLVVGSELLIYSVIITLTLLYFILFRGEGGNKNEKRPKRI
jgi:hypothetical protein